MYCFGRGAWSMHRCLLYPTAVHSLYSCTHGHRTMCVICKRPMSPAVHFVALAALAVAAFLSLRSRLVRVVPFSGVLCFTFDRRRLAAFVVNVLPTAEAAVSCAFADSCANMVLRTHEAVLAALFAISFVPTLHPLRGVPLATRASASRHRFGVLARHLPLSIGASGVRHAIGSHLRFLAGGATGSMALLPSGGVAVPPGITFRVSLSVLSRALAFQSMSARRTSYTTYVHAMSMSFPHVGSLPPCVPDLFLHTRSSSRLYRVPRVCCLTYLLSLYIRGGNIPNRDI